MTTKTEYSTVEIYCRWVPGTMDRVSVTAFGTQRDMSLQLIERQLGRPALDGLYLRGAYVTRVAVPSELVPSLLDNAAD